MPEIQNIEPSRVAHELILKPYGTYIIRSSTENDDILSNMQGGRETDSIPYVVLSVRINENQYHFSIMHYRLPLNESRDFMEYYKQIDNNVLFELENEFIVETEDTNWIIDENNFQEDYMHLFSSNPTGHMKCFMQHKSNQIKVFKKAMKDNDENEFEILKKLSYFHIATFYGILEISNQMKYLIFADHGESLKIKYSDNNYSDESILQQLTICGYQIACGMIYLESKHIIHRDLHAGNILIDEKNFIRITDFKHAITEDDDTSNSEINFRRRRLAPECFQLEKNEETSDSNETLLTNFSFKSDVWAYGLIFIELILGIDYDVYPDVLAKSNITYEEETRQLIQFIKIDRHVHAKPHDCPKNLYNLLKRCWEYEPNNRISFIDVRNEMLKLFKSVD